MLCSLCKKDDDFLIVHIAAKWDENEDHDKIAMCENCMHELNPGSHTTGISITEAIKYAFIVGLRRTLAGMNPYNTRTGGGPRTALEMTPAEINASMAEGLNNGALLP